MKTQRMTSHSHPASGVCRKNGFSRRDLSDLCVSALNSHAKTAHRRDAENAETRRVLFSDRLLQPGDRECQRSGNRLNGNNILDSSDLRPSCGLVLCSCFFVVCFADESTRTKPRNHTNQESRKDTKGQLMSQVYYCRLNG